MNETHVFIEKIDSSKYPDIPPFNPSDLYLEYPFKEITPKRNQIYEAIRNLLYLMGLDKENFNTERWNPFKNFINPGDFVLIKPNLVFLNKKNQETITTHASIIRALIDYAIIAQNKKGKIIIGDASLQSCDYDKLNVINGLQKIVKYIKSKNIDIDLIDIRTEKLVKKNDKIFKIEKNTGDPNGYTIFNLRNESNLTEHGKMGKYTRFRVGNYDPKIMQAVHNDNDHKYLISNSMLLANTIINIPKIKTHKKTGITVCLKNMIGINGHKDWLPHFIKGPYVQGGDEYINKNFLKEIIVKLNELNDFLMIYHHFFYNICYYPIKINKMICNLFLKLLGFHDFSLGSWFGNDTLWRTIADLNQIVLYGTRSGNFSSEIQRKIINFCDGIICGEGEGPLEPTPLEAGIIFSGLNPLFVDLAICELFNFNFLKIPQISKIFKLNNHKITRFKPSDLKIFSNEPNWNEKGLNDLSNLINLQPNKGWINYIKKNKKN